MATEFRGRIIYVPGKNPKPDPLLHRGLLWRALQAGLVAHQPACAKTLTLENFKLAAWNRDYYGLEKDATPDFEAIESLLAGRYEEKQDRGDAKTWRIATQRLVRSVADRFPQLMRLLADPSIRDTLAETNRYFDQQDDAGRNIREVLKVPLRRWLAEERPVLIIGHSLGSVVTWDTLWELTHLEHIEGKVDLITMGSPLGLNFTQARLQGSDSSGASGYPHMIRQWHNLAAIGDLISLDPTLADDFAEMREFGLVESIEDHFQDIYTHYRDDNGLNPHRSYGYLIHPVMAAKIAAWWWQFK